ncbi:DYH10 protein, partial [Molothrus ater]|nr:DYH10 protein [Molothrus ater]
VQQIYLQVTKKMEEYEAQKYRQWRERAEHVIPLLLKDTLLTLVTDEAATNVNPETSEQSSATDEPVSVRKSVGFALNFSPEIQEIITEAKYMEQLG